MFLVLMLFFAWLTWLAVHHWKALLVIVVALFLSLLVVISYGAAHAFDLEESGSGGEMVRTVRAGR